MADFEAQVDQSVGKHTFVAFVAVDDSSRAQDVVRAGAAYVRALRGTMVLYRAIRVTPDFSPAGMQDPIDLPAYLTQQAVEEMKVLRTFASDVPCELRVEQVIEPWEGILAAASTIDADLIVLGNHGYRGWDRVLGTTANKVVNGSHRNVLVVYDVARAGSAELSIPAEAKPET